ncbi:MAG: DMT family transporter [Rhodoferax sp.]|nr:DMT family transporter [Rhodoferax sp.]
MPPRFQRPLAYLCLALSMTLVGIYVALSKPLVAAIPVFLLAWMRFGIAAVAMALWIKKPRTEPPLNRRTHILLFFESFLGNFLFSICMLYGVSMTSAVSAGVILAGIPAVSALMSGIFLKERLGPRIWLAVGCGAMGMVMLSLGKPAPGETLSALDAERALWGNLLVFGSVVCEAAYIVIGKRLTADISPKRIAATINLYGFALMTPAGLYLALRFDFGAVEASSWGLLVFYALAASVGTVWLWMTGLKTVPAGQAGVFSVMLPLTAAAIGTFFFHEPFSTLQAGAFAVALLGLLLATVPGRQ